MKAIRIIARAVRKVLGIANSEGVEVPLVPDEGPDPIEAFGTPLWA